MTDEAKRGYDLAVQLLRDWRGPGYNPARFALEWAAKDIESVRDRALSPPGTFAAPHCDWMNEFEPPNEAS